MKKQIILAIAIVLSGLVTTAQASITPAASISGGSTVMISIPTVVGWKFRANANGVVNALGIFDTGDDGLAAPSDIGLWTIGGTLLATATVTSSDTLISGFRYATIADTALTSGLEYVVAGTIKVGDGYRFSTTVVTIPEISWLDSRAVDSPVLTFPTFFTGNTAGWFGANFSFEARTIPEPGTIAIWSVLGLAGLGVRRRKS